MYRLVLLIENFLLHPFNRVGDVRVVILLDVIVFLVNPLIYHVHLEAFVVKQSVDSNCSKNDGNVSDFLLETGHVLGSSLVHDDALSDTSLGISVLLQDWLEGILGDLSLPKGQCSLYNFEEREHEHRVRAQSESHLLSIDVLV